MAGSELEIGPFVSKITDACAVIGATEGRR